MQNAFRLIAAAVGWFALALQYWLVMTGDIGPEPVGRTINFFSYFTVLVNLLAALAMTLPVLAPNSRLGQFFSRPTVRTAIATYIVVVCATYHLILRELWAPQGWNWVADVSLHYVTPILFVLDWLLFVPKRGLPWSTALTAQVFPLVYLVWTFAHGASTGFYPYPFVDVSQLGIDTVLKNCGGMVVGFIGVALILISLARAGSGVGARA